MGIEAPVVAVALGAKVIEKHFILDKKIGGPDAHFSLDEKEFKMMVDAVRTAEKMMGKASYEMDNKKKKSREFSRSLFISEDVKKGDTLNENNLRSVRPGYGMHPKYLKEMLGKKVNRDVQNGTPFSKDLVD
ncbi:MAG: N-acetylneuraminate synthase family protein, partial [Bacteroidia bacterium]|nr:N-acetylneuraminate synthase family protein [Bacteroidia bacterium]